MRRLWHIGLLLLVALITTGISCKKNKGQQTGTEYRTKNVFIFIMDGPRYTETWGKAGHPHIPRLSAMASEGVVYTNFMNNGPTWTVPGHVAITTGHYQDINNGGNELPNYPGIFQHYLAQTGKPATAAWVIATKDKLQVLANTKHEEWQDQYVPANNCGINGTGVGSGYREDSTTYAAALNIIPQHHPNLVLINFKQPDAAGHASDWPGYISGIEATDDYIYQLWNMIQNDPVYKDNTTIFVTSDHGRHLDGWSSGFISHGDGCEGCRRMILYAAGPDFKQKQIRTEPREQIDIAATVAELLGFSMPYGDGQVMDELFLVKR